jgi:serine/threonine protein kinase
MRMQASVEQEVHGDTVIVHVAGLVDERFLGFGDLTNIKIVVLDVTRMTRMTSFGVRQWLKAIDALPKTISELYLVGCPTFFVDQLNMVLNFGGTAKVLSVMAPYTCTSCGVESGEVIDVLAERANLAKGGLPDKECARCGGKLEFDETPESYFAFVGKYAATNLAPAVTALLAKTGLYATFDTSTEKPPRIIKLVHGSVTYFRIIGTIGSMFRARPFLVGAEGEVVIDLADVDVFDPTGHKEWRRLLKSLTSQVPSVALVDVTPAILKGDGESLAMARNLSVASVSLPFGCIECERTAMESVTAAWPIQFGSYVCATCGGATGNKTAPDTLLPLRKAITVIPTASAKVIAQRTEILSRAMTDANVAQAGESATTKLNADDTILGKYKIVNRLSEGGMAEVFLAKQIGIGGFEKPVALKRIQRHLLETRHLAIDMFLNEAKIAGRLTHPNIVQVLDVGEVAGALYLAMEYVHGRDLRDVIKQLQQTRNWIPLGEACFIMREVAQALHHAYWATDLAGHQLAVVHRDVSPQNIILSYEGTVKLLDFGVAMSAITEQAKQVVVGKWLYMSPEATMNEGVDHRSDLFSLGVILYLLCARQMPFTGKDPKDIVKKIRAGQFKPLGQIVQVPERLDQLVSALLAPNPNDRPQRGQEVAAELTEIARQHGFESSSPSIAQFLSHLFMRDANATPMETTMPIVEVLRTRTDSLAPQLAQASPGPVGRPSGTMPTVLATPPRLPTTTSPLPMRPSASQPVHVPLPHQRVGRGISWMTIAVIGIAVIVAIALYFMVRPH